MSDNRNPIRRLRDFLNLSQVEFGRRIGRSHQSVANYEKGLEVTKDVIHKIKTLAAENGLADIALELSSDDWRVRTVIYPPADFAKAAKSATPPDVDRQLWHALLDAILDSGDENAVRAIQSMLRYFEKGMKQQAQPEPPKTKPARGGSK